MNFKIATWNMDSWKKTKHSAEAWQYLESLETDVAMIQEAVKPVGFNYSVWKSIDEQHRKWGSGIVSKNFVLTGITELNNKTDLLQTFPGCVAIAQINPPKVSPITVISCYGLIDEGYSQTTMHRIIADLIPLFDSRLGKRVIFAGDLNITTQLEGKTVRNRHKAILEGVKSLGLVDCLELKRESRQPLEDCSCADNPSCGHVVTYRHEKTEKKYQNDYIFASESVAKKLKSCYPIDEQMGFPAEQGKWKLSDHCPVVAEFTL